MNSNTIKQQGLTASLRTCRETGLITRKELESSFHHCGGAVKLGQACLRDMKDLESSFHHCGGSAAPV